MAYIVIYRICLLRKYDVVYVGYRYVKLTSRVWYNSLLL